MTAERHYDMDIPFDFELDSEIQNPTHSPSHAPRTDVADFLSVRPWDPQSAVLANEPVGKAPKKYRAWDGIGGDITDIYLVLQGCLCVGQMKRAEAIIKRLIKFDIPESELMKINQEFVRVSAERIVANPNESDEQDLHKWFELQIRKKDFYYDVLAYMLKVSLRESSSEKRDRLVNRYMGLLPPDLTREEQNEYGILTETELDLIHSIRDGHQTRVDLDQLKEHREDEDLASTHPKTVSVFDEYIPEDEMLEVRSTQQKGLGLKTIKKSLQILKSPENLLGTSTLTYEQRRQRQTAIEETAVRSAVERWREEHEKMIKMGLNPQLQSKSLGAMMWKWQLAMENYIGAELAKMDAADASGSKSGDPEERMNLTVWLRFLPIEKLAAITILTVMNALGIQGMDKSVPLSALIMQVGRAVQDESSVDRLLKVASKNPKYDEKKHGKLLIQNLKKRKRKAPKSVDVPSTDPSTTPGLFAGLANAPWMLTTVAQVGAFLITGLLKSAVIAVTRVNPKTEELMTQMQPAFTHTQQYKMGKKIGVIISNQTLVQQMKREPVHSLLAQHLPMIVEPEPWSDFSAGGYISQPVSVIRIKNSDKEQRRYAGAAIERGDLQQVLKGLDVLGKTSWVINRPVLQVMLEAWNSGDEIANMPPAEPQFPPIPKPPADADPLVRKQYLKAVKAQENLKGALHSQRCSQNFQLEIARALRNEVFYFPHNLDFRGRAYPVPPLLNHMGADHCRGLLKFGEARELGASGLKWLKVHLSNVFGYDKDNLSGREAFADEHRDDIYDSATKPLEGRRWWLQGEDPWQTLAACVELKDAWDSPDTTKFMSSLPVHQDGTCNGLQHYAALGGDEWGAKQVNLEPGDKPADVYSAVAELVKQSIAEDLAKGSHLAEILTGKITRKVVKQTVMTNVYGVTFVGAKVQVRRQLVAAHKDLPKENNSHPGILAYYIATKIFKSLSTMFRGAHDIQSWLGECAHRICSALMPEQLESLLKHFEKRKEVKGSSAKAKEHGFDSEALIQFKSGVVWTTPLHMPVVQPYRTSKSRIVRTNLQQVSLSEPSRSDTIHKRKQLQGFPPNFIHSLDASHMILSALKCYELGMSFAAVHDSFWTHAANIDKMNRVLRDAFIQIHSADIIGRLAAEFEVRYKGAYNLVTVKSGSPLLKKLSQLRKSPEYKAMKAELLGDFKPKTPIDKRAEELLIELKVAQMLQSNDPKTRAKAESWKTSSQIISESAAEEDFDVPAELAELGFGTVPARETKIKADKSVKVGDIENIDETPDCNLYPNAESEINMDSADPAMEETEDGQQDARYQTDTLDSAERFARSIKGRGVSKKQQSSYSSFAWVPLKFPPVPKRGSFDISRLKESQYFFS